MLCKIVLKGDGVKMSYKPGLWMTPYKSNDLTFRFTRSSNTAKTEVIDRFYAISKAYNCFLVLSHTNFMQRIFRGNRRLFLGLNALNYRYVEFPNSNKEIMK